jgi:hypothetical protein
MAISLATKSIVMAKQTGMVIVLIVMAKMKTMGTEIDLAIITTEKQISMVKVILIMMAKEMVMVKTTMTEISNAMAMERHLHHPTY